MKIWNKTHHLTDTNLILNETFTEDAFFFDIETTGFSPAYTFALPDRLCAPCG